MTFNSFIGRTMFGDLAHCEYPALGRPSLSVKANRRNATTKLGGYANGEGSASSTAFAIDAVGLGSGMIIGAQEHGIAPRDERCIEDGCDTRLSRYNRGSVCAGCSTTDRDRAHR